MAAYRLIGFSKKEYEFLCHFLDAKMEGLYSQSDNERGDISLEMLESISKKFTMR